ncbi:MAG: PD-(D/E)XK nuclease-like domain-containing protein [Cohaesibacter sp.]|jgi:hypothetical protein|nr:PD-(D/E)XK nuclease-like domain-containing protein [Cohaesibacter sp.]
MIGTLEHPHRLQKGEKVNQNGIFALPIEDYHTQICDGHSVSSSGLRLITSKSPLHYWAEYLDPQREEQDQKSHFNLGQAVHTLFLGEEGFDEKFAIRPDEFDSWRSKASKEWKADMEEQGKFVLLPSDLEKIEGMARALAKDPLIRQHGLLAGSIERSLIWQDRETGIWLKARPDVIPAVDKTIVDLKTAGRGATDEACQRAIHEHGYHMQLALVGMGMRACLGREIEDFILLFVETSKPYAYNIKPIDQRAIYLGECQIRHALRTLAECLEADHWPTYAGNGNTAYLPGYAQNRLEQDLEGGLLPDVMNPTPYMEAAE